MQCEKERSKLQIDLRFVHPFYMKVCRSPHMRVWRHLTIRAAQIATKE